MIDDKRTLARAKVIHELIDYKANGDRRHLAAIAEMMAEYIGLPDAGAEIAAILLSEKTLPKLNAKIGINQQVEDALIRHLWISWRGKRPNHEVYTAIKKSSSRTICQGGA
ncbi:hypothetical protein [Marivivens sp. JLT3646]|uniref:hypothetical protein n=1 Tax=Marivivens sp. JLT3646 TaxID=1920883 RepID=UPI0007FCE26D|nr:hypothetical protein [Marivivens sp. JLT3646]APO85627.1 hypothetical protein BSK21_00410 [Marivivens sp. JLT3646]OBR35560.1 hypothetical protein A9199_11020 [Donghicola sp. JL3646]